MKYDIVILGATSVALGLANEVKEKYKVLIINDTAMVVSEYISSYNLGSHWEYEPKEDFTREVKEELRERSIINEKDVSIYSSGSIFYKRFRKLGTDILLDTKVLGIEKQDSNYSVNIFNSAGHSKIEAKYIIDTDTGRLSKDDIVKKTINCILANKEMDSCPDVNLKDIQIIKEKDEKINTVVMKLNCDMDSELYKDRHLLIDLWRQRPENLMGWKIAAVGFCHEIEPAFRYKQIDNNYILMPSAYYGNPLIGMDEGAAKGRCLVL